MEEDGKPIEDAIWSVLPEFDDRYSGKSYFVSYMCRRPLPKTREVKKLMRNALDDFLSSPSSNSSNLPIAKGLKIHLLGGLPVEGRIFLPGGHGDHDSGGWVISELLRNIEICSKEKWEKISGIETGTKLGGWFLLTMLRSVQQSQILRM